MKNPIIIFVVIAAVILLGVGGYILSQNSSQSDSVMPAKDVAMKPTDKMMKKDDSAMEGEKMMDDKKTSSGYVQYKKSVFDSAASSRRVLFFYASWCPTCRPADGSFTKNAGKIPEDVTLIRVNYNDPETDQEEKDLAKKYGITYQHTFVQIDSNGREVTKWNGGQIDELLSKIK
ncbi:MAG TPA: thioredoxin family protein [Candidatus Levybacteria bacterium]|nr:thioredoxin family protein [Candidatus Levybacteria bacterium]